MPVWPYNLLAATKCEIDESDATDCGERTFRYRPMLRTTDVED